MPRFPSAQGRLNHEPGFHLSCDENLSEGWGPPLWNHGNVAVYGDVEAATPTAVLLQLRAGDFRMDGL